MLENLRNQIEQMNESQQINIFKILKENNVLYTENNNGIFINMSKLDEDVVDKLKDFVLYTQEQKIALDVNENIKKKYKDKYFNIGNE